ncbi:zinc-ribbon domain containing protein [Patescibacteria group bacterium]
MIKSCKKCQIEFPIIQSDQNFFEKMDLPKPRQCPECRQKKRHAFRNERSLYKRKCDLTGKTTISFYHPDLPYKVYDQKEWWKDNWDPTEYGRDFDFGPKVRGFFEQFNELMLDAPHMSMLISHGENSDYCPYSVYYKNSYMCISGVEGEDIYYSFFTNKSNDCTDCYSSFKCERCYECIRCSNLNTSIYCKDCKNSNDLMFCEDCDGCSNCIGCFGLRHKEYYVLNERVSKEKYEEIATEARENPEDTLKMFELHKKKFPQRSVLNINTENCTGDYLFNCKNSHDCYFSEELEDCAFCWNIPQGSKDSMDIIFSPKSELAYNNISAVNSYKSACNAFCWDIKNMYYCYQCFYSSDCFGCVGLKNKKYCIFNKQYSKDQYFEIRDQLIAHMKKTEEWGEFFPIEISPFAYNETIANEFYPLSKEEVLKNGWKWREPDPKEFKKPSGDVLACKDCSKNYKIIPQEAEFYKIMNLDAPLKCPDCRHKRRSDSLNPRKLWNKECERCHQGTKTSYSPKRPEKVYCEQCYLNEVV